jgi:hypothetical protein
VQADEFGRVTRLADPISGVPISAVANDFCLPETSGPGFCVHPAFYSMGTRVLSQGLSGRGVKLMPKASAVFTDEWIYTSTPCIRLDVFYLHNFNIPDNPKAVVINSSVVVKKERCEH